jgi:hypothetical protein
MLFAFWLFFFPTNMWKNSEEKTFYTVFPQRRKFKNFLFHGFSTRRKHISTYFSTPLGKTLWKKVSLRE